MLLHINADNNHNNNDDENRARTSTSFTRTYTEYCFQKALNAVFYIFSETLRLVNTEHQCRRQRRRLRHYWIERQF